MANNSFKGYPYPIVGGPLGYFGDSRGIRQIKSDLLILLLTSPGERCFTGDTKIALARGEDVPIKELVGKEPFWVYSYDHVLNAIVPGKAIAFKTLENADLMEVILDNEEKIKCTSNHLWLLRNGEYRRTDELKSGDSLMPLYRTLNTSKYERIYQPYLKDYRETHLCFVFNNKRLKGVREVVHHKDLNKRNNEPDNLQWMTCKDHKELHKIIRNAFEYKLKNDPTFYDEWLSKQKEGLRKYYSSHESYRKGFVMSEETKVKLSLSKKKYYQTEEGLKNKEKLRNLALEQFKDGSPMKGKKMTEESKQKMRVSRPSMLGDNNPSKRPEVSEKIKLSWIKRRESKFANLTEEEKEQMHKKSQESWKKRKQREHLKNHKIISVNTLPEKEDCYDLTVEQYHNFALSAGVFVHNCMLPTFGTPLKDLIFEPGDNTLVNRARQMIINSISQWEPRIAVDQISVTLGAPTSLLNKNDNLTEINAILLIQIQFRNPGNLTEAQELVLEVPLSS